MKKILLSLLMCVCVTSMAWAQANYSVSTSTWHEDDTENVVEQVVVLDVTAGHLAEALETIDQDNYQMMVIKGELSGDDIEALGDITTATIDLQDVTWSASTKIFSNENVKNLILPDGWSKDEVKAIGEAIRTINRDFGSCISQGTFDAKLDNGTVEKVSISAYVAQGNTLYDTMARVYYDGRANTKLNDGGLSRYNNRKANIYAISISGYPVARDYTGGGDQQVFDAAGHFVFDKPADETSDVQLAALGGGTRSLVGTPQTGAFFGVTDLISLDLGDAVILEENNSDLTLPMTQMLDKHLRQVVIPTCAELKTLPADFLNLNKGNLLYQICIPGNIENIKTRAFMGCPLVYVWTTGNDETIRYDNGAVMSVASDGEETFVYGQEDIYQEPLYGSYTFPANLKLIESRAFANTEPHVKDVYVLSITAPECHVDAFNTCMYMANDAYDRSAIVDGIITREAYTNNKSKYLWMTMLHYPRECGTPDIQRYTDPTRDYSIATGLKDGKGGTIYFPNQSEYIRAYLQATYGYVWNAWDPSRSTDGNNAVVNSGVGTGQAWSSEGQQAANALYESNTYTGVDKSDRTYYDTTGDGTLEKPSGQGNYWDVQWEGVALYPKPVITYGDYIYVQDDEGLYVYDGETYRLAEAGDEGLQHYSRAQKQSVDENGYLVYEACADGNFVQEYDYVKNSEGAYIHDIVVEEAADGAKVKDYSYEADEEGMYYYPLINRNYGDQTQRTFYSRTEEWAEDPEGDYVLPGGFSNTGWYVTYADFATWGNQPETAVRVKKVYRYVADANGSYEVSTTLAEWSSTATDIAEGINDTRYNKVYKDSYRDYDATTDQGETRYNVTDNGYRRYDEATDEGLDRYNRVYQDNNYRAFNADIDDVDEQRYCPVLEDAKVETVEEANDYRGWHQFVLTAYATNSTENFVPYRSYITDNDWWTICLPFDMTYRDMVRIFGNPNGTTTAQKIPYLSKLIYVIRDIANQKITLTFSKNLMEYKETVAEGFVHGEISATESKPADNDVVLHAGVPYMIRPNMAAEADGSFRRQFDLFRGSADEALADRIEASETMPGSAQMNLIYRGEYTVPAFVVNNESSAEQVASGTTTLIMGDDKTYDYTSGTVTYGGSDVRYDVSSEYTYTFVGTFYNGLLPQYSYFLGWNAKKKRAAWWYNEVADPANWTWANETGIVCANFDTDTKITPATGLDSPAKWEISDIASDDIPASSGAGASKSYDMDFGYGVTTGILEMKTADGETINTVNGVYNVNGVLMGTSADRLPKGVYIVNGKKYIVK